MSAPIDRVLALVREPRNLLLLIALYCASLLIFAMLLVRFVDLVPCPLCILQRFFYAFIGLTALIAWMRYFQPLTDRIAGVLIVIFSLLGGALATDLTHTSQAAWPAFPIGMLVLLSFD